MNQLDPVLLDSLTKLIPLITALIGLPSAIATLVKLWQGDSGLMTTSLFILLALFTIIAGVVLFVNIAQGNFFTETTLLLAVWISGMVILWVACCLYFVKPKRNGKLFPSKENPYMRLFILASLVIVPLMTIGGTSYYIYEKTQPPSKIIVLLATFDVPDPQKDSVTRTVVAQLRTALRPYADVEVRVLGRPIKELDGGSDLARKIGDERKASIVIWGWYHPTKQVVPLSVHFEVLRPLSNFPELSPKTKGQIQIEPIAKLESFELQTELSEQMASLSLFTVGMTRFIAKDWDGAIRLFSNALTQTTGRAASADQSTIYRWRGHAYLSKNDLDHGIEDYTEAIKIEPNYENYLSRAGAYDLHDAYNYAIADLNEAIRNKPNDVESYLLRSWVYGEIGEDDLANADFDFAIKLDPGNAQSYNQLGAYYMNRGKFGMAIEAFTQAIKLNPDTSHAAQVYNNRAYAYKLKGDYEHALQDYNESIKLLPDRGQTYQSLTITYYDRGDYEHAIATLNELIKVKPNFEIPYYFLGHIHFVQKKYDQGIADYHRAIEVGRSPDSPTTFQANLYKADELDQAILDYTKAIQLEPNFSYLYIVRGELYDKKITHAREIHKQLAILPKLFSSTLI